MNEKSLKTLEYDKILNQIADFAVTKSAKEKIKGLKPSKKVQVVEHMQEATEQASSMAVMFSSPPISAISDVTLALKRAKMGGMLTLAEILAVGSVLRCARMLEAYMAKTDKFEILSNMAKGLTPVKSLETDISESILSEDSVADDASSELAAIRRKKASLNNKIKDILDDMVRSAAYSKYLQEAIVTMRDNRYVLPVKNEYRSNIPGILHDSSATGATVFIEPMAVVQTNNQIRDLSIAEEREIEKIILDFSARIAENADVISADMQTITDIDVLFAKAIYGNANKCIRPTLSTEGHLELRKARHPLIDKKTVVPITVYLGKDFDTLVVTGPNTGGKTVTLKTVGLFALMFQTGLALPCELGSTMPVYTDVFADIGDEQSIEQSLSTFSSHMVNIVNILNELEKNSLVLFDELGAGTDPEEGAALAIEILEFAHSLGASALATTHYSELKLYALSTERVENASCEFDVESLRPTYKLLIGVPGKSNAFAISKKIGLYDVIIENAKKRMTSESVRFEDVISQLHKDREQAREEYAYAAKASAEVKALKEELKKTQNEIKLKKENIINSAKREAREIIDKANDETSELLREVRKLSAQAVTKDNLRKMEELKLSIHKKAGNSELKEKRVKTGTRSKDIKLGMTVNIVSMDNTGTVLTLPAENGDFFVQAGIMKIKTNVSDVKVIKDKPEKAGEKLISKRSVGSKSMTVNTELDLRGYMTYDGIMELDKFIDDAVLASLPRVSVIHGKGTGAMRAAVHDALRKNKAVKSFRLGGFGEGDTGVTIIDLK